jgi:hypothetical protein
MRDSTEILKDLVIEGWKNEPWLRWPVKVISVTAMQSLEKDQGGKIARLGGYFTSLKNVITRTPDEMEDILGYKKGTFSAGVSIWKFNELPKPEQFDLRGYTQCPNGKPFKGSWMTRSDQKRMIYFDKNGNEPDYPPGLGVEQWRVAEGVQLPATELQRLPYRAQFLNCRI